ncbi:hypothetical protein BU24DRAFT_356941 [Aaosphaeria arxii CBS 175.79]|uniref:Kinetochore protein SPC25 n=1 Tax=Aaosphaeria arxii CBS 175.79 TaxID=1450172 RepID=A0A6A5XB01_9PLEO|nr:uncharacterized protein BU24DRAFT_356941 [Aaosphaeria arxii CBS 175.79]KAF2010142.1 hypothetical protein BU24DRAFT_356941 [Aaosphaeria arxii CBS 175.79]
MLHSTTTGAPTMADTLPSIAFGFDDLRTRMNHFTARFDDFIAKGRARVLEDRNQFRINVAECQEDQRARARAIEILHLKTSQHRQTLAKESAETSEMHTAISTLTTQRDALLTTRDALRAQIAEAQRAVSARRDAQAKHRRYLDGQARYNEPELEFWERYLGLRIEGLGKEDRLRFVYEGVCEREWEREAWFELDTSEREYRVLEVRPEGAVDREAVERVVERLNESRDLGGFLKGMREVFVEAMK